jgi:putative NADPH-quinone reductase
MRVMVVYAHPVETSFNAAIFGVVRDTLLKRGHEVDACDLYAENLNRNGPMALGAFLDRVQAIYGSW